MPQEPLVDKSLHEIVLDFIRLAKELQDKNRKMSINVSRTRRVLKDRETEIAMQYREICTLKKLRRCYNCNNNSKMNVNACDKCVDFSNWVIGWKYYNDK
jgi:hypothetical protein